MYVVTPRQMRAIDFSAIEDFGIPGIVLMENAAIQMVRIIEDLYPSAKKIIVLAGAGNNGGDGLAIARHLFLAGKDVQVILSAEGRQLPEDAGVNFDIVRKLRIPLIGIHDRRQCDILAAMIQNSELIVDAIFGTGLSRDVQGAELWIIEAVNMSATPVIAVDIASGINGENGRVMGAAIKADDTVALGYPKKGHLLYPGREYAGRVHVVSISLPSDSAQNIGVTAYTMDQREAAAGLKKRPNEGHKGTFGKVAVIAGSTGMSGAACLTGMAALRSGAGLVTVGAPAGINSILENKLTEVMTFPLEDCGSGSLSRLCGEQIDELLEDKDVLAIGPGLGRGSDIFDILNNILGKKCIPIVLDADGLNHISKDIELLKKHPAPVVITPHPGEMARLTKISLQTIVAEPVRVAAEFSNRTGVIVLLKGATTVVARPDGRVYMNSTGNSGMATAGSGDVLTGLIAGLVAQRYDPFDAAVYGAFIHGSAGDLAAEAKSRDGMTAGDILEYLPPAIKKLRSLTK